MRAQSRDYQQAVVGIMQALPVERQAQVVDFARFVQWQLATPRPFTPQAQTNDKTIVEDEQWDPLETGESEEEIRMDNSRWDTLLASSESQNLLETMARQAREQFRAGQTKPMTFVEGRLKIE